jgi:hypothetical protein
MPQPLIISSDNQLGFLADRPPQIRQGSVLDDVDSTTIGLNDLGS